MDPISNADRLARLLRQKLEERAKTKKGAPASKPQQIQPRGIDAVRAATGRLATSGVDDQHLKRALVEQLLADQFGVEMINDPQFQQIVDRVFDIMQNDKAIADALVGAMADLKLRNI
jgi:hypothetical protein